MVTYSFEMLTFNGLLGITSDRTELFIITVLRTYRFITGRPRGLCADVYLHRSKFWVLHSRLRMRHKSSNSFASFITYTLVPFFLQTPEALFKLVCYNCPKLLPHYCVYFAVQHFLKFKIKKLQSKVWPKRKMSHLWNIVLM
jgi:hypothetical protein